MKADEAVIEAVKHLELQLKDVKDVVDAYPLPENERKLIGLKKTVKQLLKYIGGE